MVTSGAPATRGRKLPPVSHLAIVLIAVTFYLATSAGQLRWGSFLSFYTGGSLVLQGRVGHLYNYAEHARLQAQIADWPPPPPPFIRPPFYAVFFAAFAWMPFTTALTAWVAANIIALLGSWAWVFRRFGSLGLAAASVFLPPAVGLVNTQDCVLLIPLSIAFLLCLERGRDFAAGIVLSAGLFKFHLLLVVPLLLLINRRWKSLSGYVLGAAVLALISFALIGPDGTRAYATLITGRDTAAVVSAAPESMIDLHALLSTLFNTSPDFSIWGAALGCALAVIAGWRAPLWRWCAAAIVGSLLAAPHVYKYDAAVLLVPALLALFKSGQPLTRIAALLALSPLPYYFSSETRWLATLPPFALLLLLLCLAIENMASKPGPLAARPAGAGGSCLL